MEEDRENKWQKLDWLKGDGPPPARQYPEPESSDAGPSSRTIVYQPPAGRLFLGALFFGAGALYMAHRAQTNDRGLILNGILEFGVTGATVFYWCIAAICAAFVAIVFFFVLPQLMFKRQIVLEEDAITLPGWGLSRQHYRIPWGEVGQAKLSQHGQMTYLKVYHGGRSFAVNSTWLPHGDDMETIVRFLQRKGVSIY